MMPRRSSAHRAAPRQEASVSVQIGDGTAQRVRHHLRPAGRMQQRAAGCDHFRGRSPRPGQQAIDFAKAQRDGFERRAQNIEGLGGGREAGDRSAQIGAPVGSAFAREKRQHRQAVGSGTGGFQASLDVFGKRQVALHPGVDVAAVGERAAGDESSPVDAIAPEARRNLRVRSIRNQAHGSGGAHHQRGAIRRDASAAEVIAGSVAQRGKPAGLGERGPQGAIFGQQLVFGLIERRRIGKLIAADGQSAPGSPGS